MREQIEAKRPQLEAYEALCRELGERPADVAQAWLLHNPAVVATITGPRTVDQVTDSQRALKVTLSDETRSQLDEIWPGPRSQQPFGFDLRADLRVAPRQEAHRSWSATRGHAPSD